MHLGDLGPIHIRKYGHFGLVTVARLVVRMLTCFHPNMKLPSRYGNPVKCGMRRSPCADGVAARGRHPHYCTVFSLQSSLALSYQQQ